MGFMTDRWRTLKWSNKVLQNRLCIARVKKSREMVVFDPSLHSDNMGDEIIRRFGMKILNAIVGEEKITCVATHVTPTWPEIERLPEYKHKIVCGTNLITPHIEQGSNWSMPEYLYGYTDIITLAVGWGYYCHDISRASRMVYRNILSRKGLHSVRDRYTEKKFHEMGIHNVIFTGCVTLWEMTPERCNRIPRGKAATVITTVTDYDRDPYMDQCMLNILLDCYERVYVWIQGENDLTYLASLIDMDKIHIVDRPVASFEKVLDQGNIDYVGTRLHGGILAMNHGVRSIILAIDNRATEMGKDVNLPMLQRSAVEQNLKSFIESEFTTNLTIPWENIAKWKQQYQK